MAGKVQSEKDEEKELDETGSLLYEREDPEEEGGEEEKELDETGTYFSGVADITGKRKRTGIKKESYRFGNYHHYYGYRLDKASLDEDPRLKVFEREWFEGKDCLDIGCNEGLITISIAQKYNCRSILGLDIDGVLVDKAKCNLVEEATTFQELDGGGNVECQGSEEEHPRGSGDSDGSEEDHLPGSGDSDGKEWWKGTQAWRDLERRLTATDSDKATSGSSNLLRRVTFRKENFIKDFPHGDFMKDGTFDTVLCLSMTKWVHLNWGDGGLVRLFAKIYRILRPGGIFILEPQPWKSYKRKAHVSTVTREFFKVIRIRPCHFTEILLDKEYKKRKQQQGDNSIPAYIEGKTSLDSNLSNKSVQQCREAPQALTGRSFSTLSSWDEHDSRHFRVPKAGWFKPSDFPRTVTPDLFRAAVKEHSLTGLIRELNVPIGNSGGVVAKIVGNARNRYGVWKFSDKL